MFDYSPSFIDGDSIEADGVTGAGEPCSEDEPLLDAYSQAIVDVVDAVGPAVVRVDTQADPVRRTRGGMGSGVIISPDGLVLTNSHVVQGEHSLRLALPDARTMEARIVGDDPDTDLALLRVVHNATLPMARLGNSKALRRGQLVIAIGNPLGFESTVAGQTVPLPRPLALALGLTQTRAVAVTAVEPGSPAARGGLAAGMIVVAVAGEPVTGADDVVRLLDGERIGVPTGLSAVADGKLGTFIIVPVERDRH